MSGGLRFDVEDQVCVAQVIAASAVSAHSIQKKLATSDPTIGRRLAMRVSSNTTAPTGAASWALQVVQADVTALTTNIEVLSQVTVADADLALGKFVEVPIPQGVWTRKHLGLRAVPTGGSSPSITIDAYLVPQDENTKYKSFPKAVDAAV